MSKDMIENYTDFEDLANRVGKEFATEADDTVFCVGFLNWEYCCLSNFGRIEKAVLSKG